VPTSTIRTIDELLDYFEDDLVIEVYYSGPDERRQTVKARFGKGHLPDQQFPCPQADCSGGGFSMLDTLGPIVSERREQLENEQTTERRINEERQPNCQGSLMRDKIKRSFCSKTFTVRISGTLK
jgi:hypothetical protein